MPREHDEVPAAEGVPIPDWLIPAISTVVTALVLVGPLGGTGPLIAAAVGLLSLAVGYLASRARR